MYNPYSLEGKTILVTGASSGIGQATAIECSKLGANVIVTARNEEKLRKTLDALEGNGHQMFLCDLNKEEDIDNLISSLPEIQCLVNNAGYTNLLPVQFINSEQFNKILTVNTVAPILILQKLLKRKKLKKGASVVFTSSLAGLGYGTVGNSMYSASKGAISSFIRVAAKELSPKGIRVNAVCPSMIETSIMEKGNVSQEQLDNDKKNYPLGYGEPRDVALSIVFLLSDAAKWITSTNMIVDCGAV
ncbi:MAG: SDR family oxidoreductase [Prevotella sp.]|nr:SDR family oxidoreductase [Prevotella sp.]